MFSEALKLCLQNTQNPKFLSTFPESVDYGACYVLSLNYLFYTELKL